MDAGDLAEGAELYDFVDELLRDRELGRERPLAEYLARHPGHERALVREWLALREPVEDAPADAAPGESPRVGPWRLVRELGRGGQGAVWLAEDTRIARRAALKLLPETFALVDADRRRRLRREAEALARIEHPGICPVLEAEIEGERPYLALRLIEGETLAAAIARAREGGRGPTPLPLAPRDRAGLETLLAFFEAAARALHVAHEAGLVHRDVKPGNVMVTPEGRPVLLDFGQALDQSGTLEARTLSGDVFGTPAYMSPEQVGGRTREIDRRTDVWSLGATLVEALTLEPAFEGTSVAELALAIEGGPLPPLRAQGIPRDLAVVAETALERDLTRRYASALELAEDLRRVREHEPVRARPAGPPLRLARWSRRHPGIAASLAVVLLALTGGLAWTLHLLAREERALEWALGSHLAKRTLALIAEDPSAALALGIEAVELAPSYETRSALLAALDACALESLIEASPARRILDLALSPDGLTLAAATDVGTALLYDLDQRAVLGELQVETGAVQSACFVAEGAQLVTAGDDGRLRWWDARTQRLLRAVEGPGGGLLALAVDPAGSRLAVSSRGGRLALLSARDGTQQAVLDGLASDLDTLRFAADGARLLAFQRGLPGHTAAHDAPALLVDVELGRVERELGVAAETLTWACLIPARQAYATASLAGRVRVVSLVDGGLVAGPFDFPGPVWCVSASPDGARLAIACEAGGPSNAWLLDLERRDPPRPLSGHDQARVVHAAFSPDGTRVATSSFDTTVRVFESASARPVRVLRGFVQPLESLWSPDGKRLITLGNGSSAPVWFARGPPDLLTLSGHEGPVTLARLSPDGTRAVTVSQDGTARMWSTTPARASEPLAPATGGCVGILQMPGERAVLGACFPEGDSSPLAWCAGAEAMRWDPGAPRPIEPGAVHAAGYGLVEPSPDGRRLALIDAQASAWMQEGWPPRARTVRLGDSVDATCIAFSPDGARVALGTGSGRVHLFDAAGAPIASWPEGVEVGPVASVVDLVFAPDSSALALVREDRKVRFLRVGEALEPLRPPLTVFPPLSIDWSADGSRLLVVGREGRGAFRLHDLVHDRQVTLELFHAGNLTCGEFSPDGRLVLSGSLDGTVYVRSAVDGTPVAHLVGHAGPVLDASFSRDDGPLRVITGSADGSARVWPVDPLPPARARRPRELKSWEREREARLASPLRYRRRVR